MCKHTDILQSSNLGSTEERTILEKAEEYGCQREKSNPPVADVDLVLPTLEISRGDDFELSLEFINRSTQHRTVEAYISGSVAYYTGVTSYEFLFRNPTVKIGPNQSERGIYLFLTNKNRLRSISIDFFIMFILQQQTTSSTL